VKKNDADAYFVIPKIVTDAGRSPDRSALTGCPWHDVKAMLREVGLRPTRQRMALAGFFSARAIRHLTPRCSTKKRRARKSRYRLATIYNTLHQFTEVGLLRQVAVDGSKAYFDTNATAHHHFLSKAKMRCSTSRTPR
jgi:Fur family iron response transcriptional regulator